MRVVFCLSCVCVCVWFYFVSRVQLPPTSEVLSGMGVYASGRHSMFLVVTLEPTSDRRLLQIDILPTGVPNVHAPMPLTCFLQNLAVRLRARVSV